MAAAQAAPEAVPPPEAVVPWSQGRLSVLAVAPWWQGESSELAEVPCQKPASWSGLALGLVLASSARLSAQQLGPKSL